MANVPVTLEDALKQYDREADKNDVAIAEKERQEVVKRFPLDSWPTLTLSRYALGQDNKQDCFCWWMEFGAAHAGSIRGGSAVKHIIYRQRNGEWFFDGKRYKNEQEAWEGVRAGFVQAFQKADNHEWDTIDQIEGIAWGPALRTKALYCYFPDEVLPIYSLAHLRHFIKMVGDDHADLSGYDTVRVNRLLLENLRKIPQLKGWSTKEVERFLYYWANPLEQRRVVKIAPGENARFWPECLEGGYICVGWAKMGDLREFQSKEAFEAAFKEAYADRYGGQKAAITKKGRELWTLRELEAGDLIVANQGISKVLAVGAVVEPCYEYAQDRPEYRHHVHVKWDTSYATDIPPQKRWGLVTVADVPQELAALILTGKGKPERLPVDPLYREIADALERKGQVILYGPPGTGKTYTARRFAVWWLSRQTGKESPAILTDSAAFNEAEQRLSTAQVVRRVWWVVANPKEWSWDRLFAEKRVSYRYGRLQRNYPLVRKDDLVVGYEATPEKRLVALAKISRELHTNTNGEQTIDLEPIARIENGPTYEEIQKDEILSESEPMRFRNQGTLFALTADEFDQLASLLTERDPNLRKYVEGSETVGPLTRLSFHASYSYEDFIEGYRPVESKGGHLALRLEDGIFKRICREAQANPKKPYLVLIDEINRANVAKVLGELITLLEKDKRGLLISLPQSKEAFTIPPNVYLLGTMNTADRSIKLLDAALRRRFAFLELMPNSSLLEGGKIRALPLDEFLDKLNERIAAKEGREKQIGHSFLMEDGVAISDPEEFARRFRQEILPLLQEYCYDDYRVLAEYIGDELVDQDGQTLNGERLADPEALIGALEKAFADKDSAS